MHKNSNDKQNMLFETSWEVCHKVGGIYTVLSTKATVLHRQFGDNLVFIGPDIWTDEVPSPYFEQDNTLLQRFASSTSLPEGITVKTGRWKIPSSPIAVLVGFQNEYAGLNAEYAQMWDRYGVDSLHAYGDYSEGCAFAVAASRIIIAIMNHLGIAPHDVTAHFNEWTTGMGLLHLQIHCPEVATIFTTHATSIGRSICSNGKPLYDYFEGYHGDQMAAELNMESKHSLEKRAAHAADCFTAVSELTARECSQLLDIRPQVVTPNGFEFKFVPTGNSYTSRRRKARARLLAVARALTGHDIPDNALLVATSGRHEYRNKGIDVFLDAMSRVRDGIEAESRPIVAFVMVPGWVKEPSKELQDKLAGAELNVIPDFLTHRLNDEDSDEVVARLGQISRHPDSDRLPVIYMPCYLDGRDGIVDISYYDILPGLDLTIFPSYYEPWGYTPLESIAFSVPTVTTDKSGFGMWVLDNFENSLDACGVKVVARNDSGYADTVAAIADEVLMMSSADDVNVAEMRKLAKATAKCAEWRKFIKKYQEAFRVAAMRRDERLDTANR